MSLGPDSIRLWEHHIGDVPTAVWVPLRPFISVRQSVCLQPPQHESMLAETTMPHFGTSRLLWRPSLTSQIARLPYMTRNYRADKCRLFKCQERGRIRVEGGDRGGETEKNLGVNGCWRGESFWMFLCGWHLCWDQVGVWSSVPLLQALCQLIYWTKRPETEPTKRPRKLKERELKIKVDKRISVEREKQPESLASKHGREKQ